MKRLILCLDGTWNKADGSHPFTNVVKIRDAVDRSGSQRVYYDEGVGTANTIDRFIGGAIGRGLARNVRQAYKYICKYYEPGDEIHLVGFSRGAYTARSVAGYIGASGLLRNDACTTEREELAWNYYRTFKHDRAPGDRVALNPFCHPDVKIKCIAVFDTVGALGVPTEGLQWIGRRSFQFHDTRLGSSIEHAFHAVAIDERRAPFEATLWEQPFHPLKPKPHVEQVWFSGVHSSIGGGYPDHEMSDIALHWMVNRLQSIDVEFTPVAELPSLPLNSGGKMHESRSIPLYSVSRIRPMHRTMFGRPLPKSWRWRTPVRAEYKPIGESIHVAVLERMANERSKYRPRQLVHLMKQMPRLVIPVVDWDGEPLRDDDAVTRVRELVA